MRFPAILLSLLFMTGGNAFAGDDLMSKLGDMQNLFDSGLGFKSETTIPNPFSGGNWGAAPKIKSSGAKTGWTPYNDALTLEPCQFVDAVNIRQPTLEESVKALGACLKAVSEKYKTNITATQDENEIVLVISGIIPAGSTVSADLRHSIGLREGRLFGHKARVLRLARTPIERQRSSLQFVVDRCPTTKMIHTILSSNDFISLYGECIRGAKGLEIKAVLASPVEPNSILVYSKDRKDIIAEMNGIISIPSVSGRIDIQVLASQEVLNSTVLPALLHPRS